MADGHRAAEVIRADRQPDRAQFGSGDAQAVAHRVQVQDDVQLVDLVVVRQDVAAGRWTSSGQVAAGKKRTTQLPDRRTSCPAKASEDTAEPIFGFMDKAVASDTGVG